MQPIVTDQPYEFVPPYHGNLWPALLKCFAPGFLRKHFGVNSVEIRGAEKLQESVVAGRGVLLAPNHCRMADPLVMQMLSKQLRRHFFIMASSHVFYQASKIQAWLIRRSGAFSVYREGVDRVAVKAAVDILAQGRRPLVIFPEGSLSHANDRLNALMAGVPFIARAAARRCEKESNQETGGVLVVPVAIKYLFQGDIHAAVEPMLDDIETRLSWRPQQDLSLVERLYKLGHALLTVKEMEYFEEPQSGELDVRLQRLIDHLLNPLEEKWLDGRRDDSVIGRVKDLRKAVLPDMIDGGLSEQDQATRWRDLEDMYLAQQLSLYPPQYVASRPTVDRVLETVDRFMGGLTGNELPHPPIHAIAQVGDALEVESRRPRGAEVDPLLQGIEDQLSSMLEELAGESRTYVGKT